MATATSRDFPNLAGGVFAAPAGAWLEVADPARPGRVVARVPATTPAEIAATVDAAAAGWETWRVTPPSGRAEVLRGAAAWLRGHTDEVARLVSAEMGKTLAEAAAEVGRSADFFDYYAGLHRLPWGELLHDARPGVEASVRLEPVGLVVAITPWNDPLLTPARKLAPALFAGNVVIVKPASETPVSTLLLARALHEGGAPAGVVSTVTGPAASVIEPLLADARIAAVTFTGSTEVGLGLQRTLAGRNIRLQTEMGGKNPSVVLADADLDLAADTIAAAAFGQAGQRCTATSRVIVDARIADALTQRLCARAQALVVGPGDAPETQMGPVVSERQRTSILADIDAALAEGAVSLTGDGRTAGPEVAGWCVSPVVLTGVRHDMAIWRDEVFGPVIAILEVASLEEAIAAANDSAYGLAASLFTESLMATQRFVAEVEAGQIAVNLPTTGWDVHLPFGGWKLSGSSFKEQGREGLQFYTRVKTVAVRSAGAS